MSHATADLEYFKCDVCGVYLHRDIFCDHRRDCKGLNSTELKKSECKVLQERLDQETRRLIAAQEATAIAARTGGAATAATPCSAGRESADYGSSAACAGAAPQSSCTAAASAAALSSAPSHRHASQEPEEMKGMSTGKVPLSGTSVLLSTAQLEKRAQDKVRRDVADAYQREKERQLEQRLKDEARRKELLAFLDD